MQTIKPIRVQFRSKQQEGLELLLEHYISVLPANIPGMLSHCLLAEWLLKVKQRNIMEKQSASYELKPALRLAIKHASGACTPQSPLAMSVEAYLLNINEQGLWF
jgi:hypothetical protein